MKMKFYFCPSTVLFLELWLPIFIVLLFPIPSTTFTFHRTFIIFITFILEVRIFCATFIVIFLNYFPGFIFLISVLLWCENSIIFFYFLQVFLQVIWLFLKVKKIRLFSIFGFRQSFLNVRRNFSENIFVFGVFKKSNTYLL